jgi:hypothetical protein
VSAFARATGDSKVNGNGTCNGHQAVGLLRLRSDMKMEPCQWSSRARKLSSVASIAQCAFRASDELNLPVETRGRLESLVTGPSRVCLAL